MWKSVQSLNNTHIMSPCHTADAEDEHKSRVSWFIILWLGNHQVSRDPARQSSKRRKKKKKSRSKGPYGKGGFPGILNHSCFFLSMWYGTSGKSNGNLQSRETSKKHKKHKTKEIMKGTTCCFLVGAAKADETSSWEKCKAKTRTEQQKQILSGKWTELQWMA